MVALLILLRRQLTNLATRLIKVSFPGGIEASFGEALEEARKKTEQILIESAPERKKSTVEQVVEASRAFDLAQHFPEAAVLEAFKEAEDMILRIREYLPEVRDAKSLNVYIQELGRRELIDANTVRLFDFLRNLRNIAAHGGGGNRITPGEAVEYQAQCEVLVDKLDMALDTLRYQCDKKNPR